MTFKSDQIDKLAAALTKAQAQFKPVGVDKKVSIPTRDGKAYSYDYATLSAIMEATRKPLSDNGLAISQPIVGDELLTILMHESGQFIISSIALPTGGDIKGFGANISYIRRYALAPLVGIAVGEEDDENITGGKVELKPIVKDETNGKRKFNTPREGYLAKIDDLLVECKTLGYKPELEPNFLKIALDSELIDFGTELKRKINEIKATGIKA